MGFGRDARVPRRPRMFSHDARNDVALGGARGQNALCFVCVCMFVCACGVCESLSLCARAQLGNNDFHLYISNANQIDFGCFFPLLARAIDRAL